MITGIVLNNTKVERSREELTDWLTLSTRPVANHETHKLLSLTNHSTDQRGHIVYIFDAQVPVQPLGITKMTSRTNPDTKRAERVFTSYVDPGQRVDILCGPFADHTSRQVSATAPDKAFYVEQAVQWNEEIDRMMVRVRTALRQQQQQQTLSISTKPVTSEVVAQACVLEDAAFVDFSFPPKHVSLSRDWEGAPFISATANPIVFQSADRFLRGTAKLKSSKPAPSLFGTPETSVSPSNVFQGTLGDCYLCCTMSCLATNPTLVYDIFSCVQSPSHGVYRLMICKFGWWQSVVVDEFVPVQGGRFAFARNKANPEQLWVPLLEKAYAKCYGSYAAIRAGDAPLAMMDLTGCPYKQLKSLPEFDDKTKLFYVVKDLLENNRALLTMSTPSRASCDPEEFIVKSKKYDAVGLTTDHVYSVIDAVECRGVKLLRMRDPWGGGSTVVKSWRGAYGPESAEYRDPSVRNALHSTLAANAANKSVVVDNESLADVGAFWIPWEEATRYFDAGALCYMLRDWRQLRVQASLTASGHCSRAIRLIVKDNSEGPLRLYVGVHQKDRRGAVPSVASSSSSSSSSSTPAGGKLTVPSYLSVLISVLRVDLKQQKTIDVVSESDAKGVFGTYRDVFAEVQLPPNRAGEAYVVLVQALPPKQSTPPAVAAPHKNGSPGGTSSVAAAGGGAPPSSSSSSSETRPVVVSLVMDEPHCKCDEITILELELPTPPGGNGATSSSAPYLRRSAFPVTDYAKVSSDVTWQVRVTQPGREGMLVKTHAGGVVDPNIFSIGAHGVVEPHHVGSCTAKSHERPLEHATESLPHANNLLLLHVDPHDVDTHGVSHHPPNHHPVVPLLPPSSSSTAMDVHHQLPSHLSEDCGAIHLLLLDAVVSLPLDETTMKTKKLVVNAVVKLMKDGGGAEQAAQTAVSIPSDKADELRSRVVLLCHEGDGQNVDAVLRDEARTDEDGQQPDNRNSCCSYRALWCEAAQVRAASVIDPSTLSAKPRLECFIHASVVVREEGTDAVVATLSGVVPMGNRNVSRGSSGHMITVPLFEVKGNVENATAETNATIDQQSERGEVHMGFSWV